MSTGATPVKKPAPRVDLDVVRDRLMKLDLTLGADPGRPWRLEVLPNATPEQAARLTALLEGK